MLHRNKKSGLKVVKNHFSGAFTPVYPPYKEYRIAHPDTPRPEVARRRASHSHRRHRSLGKIPRVSRPINSKLPSACRRARQNHATLGRQAQRQGSRHDSPTHRGIRPAWRLECVRYQNAQSSESSSLPQSAQATLIAVTGYGQQYAKETAIAAGFDYYFVKPASPVELTRLLATLRPICSRLVDLGDTKMRVV